MPTGIEPANGSQEGSQLLMSYDSVPSHRQCDILASRRGQYRIDARKNAFVEFSALEPWNDIGIENRAGFSIRQHAFESVADLNANLAIAGRPQEQQAVVAILFADAPEVEYLFGDFFDGKPVERSNDDDRHFNAVRSLDIADRLIEARHRFGAQGAGHIGNPRAVFHARVGDAGERLGAGAAHARCRQNDEQRRP